ncbi:unnamed protein product, partial [Coregonus sp. 'balchen']
PNQSSHGERYSLPSTSTEQIKTEPYVEDYGVSEPTRESQPFSAVDTECSAAQSENRGHIDWMETGGPLSGLTLKPLKSKRTKTVEGQSSHISVKDRKLNHLKSHSRPSVSWDAAPSCKRLIAAAEEIFGVVEETIAEYQEEVSRTKEENSRLRIMLEIRTKPEIKLHRR